MTWFMKTGQSPVIIVSRHQAAVEFIREQLVHLVKDAPVLAEASAVDCADRIVIGNVPMHLAAVAHTVIAVEFRGVPPRGAELTLDQMKAAGAMLAAYRVDRVAKVQMRTLDGMIVLGMSSSPPDASGTRDDLSREIRDAVMRAASDDACREEYAPYKEQIRMVAAPSPSERLCQAMRQCLTGKSLPGDWVSVDQEIDAIRHDCDPGECDG